ncbi:MBL fold metallo-hydrolase [Thermobifida halotolerans]|uniref:MBL fold metallo-hydrolase n=1 Tax=Thermobifida halotolerans TaxID=483545 RepID=A0A399FZJ8_9ACTN|nr:MBL fold metallo-hydrolase [Thermobifida halotolerans]UOE19654.1 MBL fold metallo-hydrolase [Thermobifida halotolerans]
MRELPPVEEVADGLWSIPVPFPDSSLGHTLVYALHTARGPVLVDAGCDHEESWRGLCAGLETAGTRIEDVHGVVVTHFHGDHLGLAGRVRAASGAWVAAHRADIDRARFLRHLTPQEFRETELGQLRRAGASEDEIRAHAAALPPLLPLPLPDRALVPGELADLPGHRLRVVWTPGHTPGHVCLHLEDAGLLLTGDHLLPRITPHIALYPLDADHDPLGDFLDSLTRVAKLGATTALPAHEHRFTGIPERAATIADHHEDRLAELSRLLSSSPATLWTLTSRLSWRRGWDRMPVSTRRLAASEIAAHLRLLHRRGVAVPVTDGSGTLLWAAARG